MTDPCREAFEKWAVSVGRSVYRPSDDPRYLNNTESEWRGWQASWNTRSDRPAGGVDLSEVQRYTLWQGDFFESDDGDLVYLSDLQALQPKVEIQTVESTQKALLEEFGTEIAQWWNGEMIVVPPKLLAE